MADGDKCKKRRRTRPQAAIQRQWIRRAARIAKSEGAGGLAAWLLKQGNFENEARFKRELQVIRDRLKARAR